MRSNHEFFKWLLFMAYVTFGCLPFTEKQETNPTAKSALVGSTTFGHSRG
jgi:hypothetical protein